MNMTHEMPRGLVTLTARMYGGSGPLVICLHGFPDTEATWDPWIGPLVQAGYRVLVPVMRGYTHASRSEDGDYHAVSLADDIIAWLDHLGEARAFLLGHDWGAVAGWVAIARAAHRFHAFVPMAIPFPGGLMSALPRHPKQWRNSWYIAFFQSPWLPEFWLSRSTGGLIERLWRDWSPGWSPPPAIMHAACERLSDPRILGAALGYYRCLGRPWTPPNREWLLLLGHAPRVPVLALAGERDGCIDVALFCEAMSRVEVPRLVETRVMTGVGHFMHLEAPRRVLEAVLPFLRQWTSSPG